MPINLGKFYTVVFHFLSTTFEITEQKDTIFNTNEIFFRRYLLAWSLLQSDHSRPSTKM